MRMYSGLIQNYHYNGISTSTLVLTEIRFFAIVEVVIQLMVVVLAVAVMIQLMVTVLAVAVIVLTVTMSAIIVVVELLVVVLAVAAIVLTMTVSSTVAVVMKLMVIAHQDTLMCSTLKLRRVHAATLPCCDAFMQQHSHSVKRSHCNTESVEAHHSSHHQQGGPDPSMGGAVAVVPIALAHLAIIVLRPDGVAVFIAEGVAPAVTALPVHADAGALTVVEVHLCLPAEGLLVRGCGRALHHEHGPEGL